MIRQTRSPSLSGDQRSSRVEDSAQSNHKDDLDYSDWVCSSSTNSSEPSESETTLQVDQLETCPLSPISGTSRHRQTIGGLASVKSEKQHKRKASITDLILEAGHRGQDIISLSNSR